MGYKEVWFITGASTGFGLHLTKGLLQNGHRVAAVTRDREFLPDPGTSRVTATGESAGTGWLEGDLLCLTADLTSEDSVQAAIQQTIGQFGRIDNVVNYGGYDLPGPIEKLSECVIRQYFEENVFGNFHVLKQVIPYLRAQRSGTILNFYSAAVVAAAAGSVLYTATKLAIKSFTEELTAGIEDLGIQQTFIGPAASLQRDDESLLQKDREGIFSKKDNTGAYRQQPLQRAALV
jgi:NAD(P)-dependent dehydrogenase (short-subunit alcohol dehydrogenase family)